MNIGKDFFPNKSVVYPYGSSSIETRMYILYECVQYMKSWNFKRELLKYVLMFSELNPGAFYFKEGITQS